MSYVAPSNVISISTPVEVIASGTVQVQLNIKQISGIGTDFNTELYDVGEIDLDFNYIEDAGNIDDFTINVPRINVTLDNRLSSNTADSDTSLINIIRRLDSSDLIVMKFLLTDSSGQPSTDFFYSTREQCEYDFLERTVKIDAKHPLKYGQIGFGQEFYSALDDDEYTIGEGQGGARVYLVKDFVEKYLQSLSVPKSTVFATQLYDTPAFGSIQNGDDVIIYQNSGEGTVNDDTDFDTATQQMKRLSLTEAAIVGNAMGYAYYMPRFNKDVAYRASLSADDFSELDMDVSFRDIRFFSLNIDIAPSGRGITDSTFPIVEDVINNLAVNDVNITYDEPPSIVAANRTTSGPEDFSPTNINIDSDVTGFTDNLVGAYKKVFRISDPPTASNPVDAGIMISGKILGIDKLKPYEHFSVSNTDPLVDGKTFRPAYLKYSLKDDIIEFEAYEF